MLKNIINFSTVATFLVSMSAFSATNFQLNCGDTKIDLGANLDTVLKSCGAPSQNLDKTDNNIAYKKLKYVTYMDGNKTEIDLKFVNKNLVDVEYSKESSKYDL